jgi:hypothetical protein
MSPAQRRRRRSTDTGNLNRNRAGNRPRAAQSIRAAEKRPSLDATAFAFDAPLSVCSMFLMQPFSVVRIEPALEPRRLRIAVVVGRRPDGKADHDHDGRPQQISDQRFRHRNLRIGLHRCFSLGDGNQGKKDSVKRLGAVLYAGQKLTFETSRRNLFFIQIIELPMAMIELCT